jgi:hypothetical protein
MPRIERIADVAARMPLGLFALLFDDARLVVMARDTHDISVKRRVDCLLADGTMRVYRSGNSILPMFKQNSHNGF